MIEKVKQLRVEIDGLAQLTTGLKPNQLPGSTLANTQYNSLQIENAADSLLLGKAWLGKVLAALGNESPYPKDGTRKTEDDIEPTADKAVTGPSPDFNTSTHISKVDQIRQLINGVVDALVEINPADATREFSIARTNAYTHLSEARFWLGFELERIKNA